MRGLHQGAALGPSTVLALCVRLAYACLVWSPVSSCPPSDTCACVQTGRQALHIAVEGGGMEMVALLAGLDRVDVNARDRVRAPATPLR